MRAHCFLRPLARAARTRIQPEKIPVDHRAPPEKRPGPKGKREEKPLRIVFGDCGGEATRFVSGPSPAPFQIDTANVLSQNAVDTETERRKLLAALPGQPPPKAAIAIRIPGTPKAMVAPYFA